jgi:hypothetical protein
MLSGRRGFLKTLGGMFAGLTVAGKLKLDQERKAAPPYVRKYIQSSIPVKKSLTSPYVSGVFYCSGIVNSDNPPIRSPKLLEEI